MHVVKFQVHRTTDRLKKWHFLCTSPIIRVVVPTVFISCSYIESPLLKLFWGQNMKIKTYKPIFIYEPSSRYESDYFAFGNPTTLATSGRIIQWDFKAKFLPCVVGVVFSLIIEGQFSMYVMEKRTFSDAMTHYESTPFNSKPIVLQEEPDNLVFPNVALFRSRADSAWAGSFLPGLSTSLSLHESPFISSYHFWLCMLNICSQSSILIHLSNAVFFSSSSTCSMELWLEHTPTQYQYQGIF